jgi:hypothetical protein
LPPARAVSVRCTHTHTHTHTHMYACIHKYIQWQDHPIYKTYTHTHTHTQWQDDPGGQSCFVLPGERELSAGGAREGVRGAKIVRQTSFGHGGKLMLEVYTHIYTHVHTCTCRYTHMYITCTCVSCLCVCVCVYTHMHMTYTYREAYTTAIGSRGSRTVLGATRYSQKKLLSHYSTLR